MEYTRTGHEATWLLPGTESSLALTIRPFDYQRSDLSEFRTGDKTVVFTSYSIERMLAAAGQ